MLTILDVDVELLNCKTIKGVYIYAIRVSVIQNVTVLGNGRHLLTDTWSVGTVGSVGGNKMSKAVRGNIGDLVDEFLNAYLSVNPTWAMH
jgi:hypothetical protein